MRRTLLESPSARARLDAARAWLAARGRDERLLVVAASSEAAGELAREITSTGGSTYGWTRQTLARLAGSLAAPLLAEAGLVAAGSLSLEALCTRLVFDLAPVGGLGRFTPLAEMPGLARALARTFRELRVAGIDVAQLTNVDPDLGRLLAEFEGRLVGAGLADRATVLRLATERAATMTATPLLLLDVPIASPLEEQLVAALVSSATDVLATTPRGDGPTRRALESVLGVAAGPAPQSAHPTARLQERLFTDGGPAADGGSSLVLLSSAGEARECVEIARRLQEAAARGVPFDRMAVLLRAPHAYRALMAEALRRADIPAWFARGTMQPDPAGRSFLALLACAADGISARRFAEYLSLGEVPSPTAQGAPPPAVPASDTWVPPDDEVVSEALTRGRSAPATEAAWVPAPRRWERVLIDAKVLGGRERWAARLAAHRTSLALDLEELTRNEDSGVERVRADLEAVDGLVAFSLPLVEALASLPIEARWGDWLDLLAALATRALRHPERVLATIAELRPMSDVGPVGLDEVRLVLAKRLTKLARPPPARRYGAVFVGPIEAARGLAFDVVCVAGLAERIFPQRVGEDPLLRDDVRIRLGPALETNALRAERERLALRLGIGAAIEQAVVSWPRLDVQQAKPRVPSFYGLELVRAAEGELPAIESLRRRAGDNDRTRLAWPAPRAPEEAIDEAEHDLSLLHDYLHGSPADPTGHARYLLSANPHLARALRVRARRGLRRWTAADGLVEPAPEAKEALTRHGLAHRSYSPTALQNYATCPYKFLLQAIHRLSPREVPAPVEELDPLQFGALVHEIQYESLTELRAAELLPITTATLEPARQRLDRTVDRIAAKYRDELAPTIGRVWDDGIAVIRADLREWLRRMVDDAAWAPSRFELSFGLGSQRGRDPASTEQPVALDCGVRLRGSIDLVEQRADGRLRATDYKTGKVRAVPGAVIGGGKTLQPVFYALTLEKLFPDAKVDGGRLYYCTTGAEFTAIEFPLDAQARDAAQAVATTIGNALDNGFLPAAPEKDACRYCDYRPVCGPDEERRIQRKPKDLIAGLVQLRARP